ncbi:unnamed protein product, partial [Protopolystoma xenopodis]
MRDINTEDEVQPIDKSTFENHEWNAEDDGAEACKHRRLEAECDDVDTLGLKCRVNRGVVDLDDESAELAEVGLHSDEEDCDESAEGLRKKNDGVPEYSHTVNRSMGYDGSWPPIKQNSADPDLTSSSKVDFMNEVMVVDETEEVLIISDGVADLNSSSHFPCPETLDEVI